MEQGHPLPPSCSAIPENGWIVVFFSAGGAPGALCLTGRAPLEDDNHDAIRAAIFERARAHTGGVAQVPVDVLLLHLSARRCAGVRVTARTPPMSTPSLEGMRALLVGADNVSGVVHVSAELTAEDVSVAETKAVQRCLLNIVGSSLQRFDELTWLVLSPAAP